MFDLQAHSTHSDGALAPAAVVRLAHEAGVELLALTDHDTVAGVPEALATARELGLALVPAVELSALDDGQEDLHILGYGIDHGDPRLLDALTEFRHDREARSERMAGALAELGWEVEQAPLAAQRRSGGAIGRPHLARAVFEHPGNAARLRDEALATPESVLEAYLIPGRPAFRGRTKPTVAQAIELIHDSGGVAVWAHPFWDIDADQAVLDALERFTGFGIDGVEAFYITHTAAQTHLLDDAARRLDLLSTGSADFHGPEHRMFSRFGAFECYGREPRLGPIVAGEADQRS